jgi:hypothetical protein
MKDFGVEVKFRAYIKVTWTACNPGSRYEINQRAAVDINETLELRPQYEGKKFVTAYLVNKMTGQVSVVLHDEAAYRMVDKALKKARKLIAPAAFAMGKKPPERKT